MAHATPPAPPVAEVLLTFLESVGRRSDVDFYVSLFRRLPKESFATIAAEAPVVRYAIGSLAERLRFLRELGLFAPVALGLFEPDVAERGSRELAEWLTDAGMSPVIRDAADPRLADVAREDLRSERTPIVSFAACGAESVDDRFDRLGGLARALESRKLVVLNRRGALGPAGGWNVSLGPGHSLPMNEAGISVVNLRSDYEALRASTLLLDDERRLLDQLRRVLLAHGGKMVASVASPLTILRELFTAKGAGTLVKLGTAIERRDTYGEIDVDRLRALLESSFAKDLAPDFFSRPILSVYLEEEYRGAAILTPSRSGVPFLTKFAVDRVAQGEGVARDLWQALTRDHASVFWRARPENPIGPWYSSLCDGLVRTERWHVYWRGADVSAIPALVDEALAQPEDFARAGSPAA